MDEGSVVRNDAALLGRDLHAGLPQGGECTESFLEGHVRAFGFFAKVPTRINYDCSKIAVGKIVGDREGQVTAEFQRLQSPLLYEDHFCLVGRPN